MSAGRAIVALAWVLVWPGIAVAAGGGGHEPSWRITLLGFLNFSIYLAAMRYLAWPVIKDYLQDRRDQVVEALEAAATARKDAEALKAEFEERMKGLEVEAEKAREEILEIARAEAGRLLEQAERTAESIRKDARLVADQEVARARRDLQQEAVDLVAKAATALVTSQLTDEDQARFVKDFVAETSEELP